MEERLTKNQLKEKRKLENLRRMEETQKSSGFNMKLIVIGIVILLFLGFASYLFISSKQAQKERLEKAVTLSSMGQKIGSESAKVTLVEFGDFQCPACKSYEPTLKEVKKVYGDDLLFIFKHFPLKSLHPNALPAAIAAEAAARQGKFWEYHTLLYENQGDWANLPDPASKFEEYASKVGLDLEKYNKDIEDKNIQKEIDSQINEGIEVGVNATPTFYLNGKYLNVNSTFDSFKKAIDKVLNPKN